MEVLRPLTPGWWGWSRLITWVIADRYKIIVVAHTSKPQNFIFIGTIRRSGIEEVLDEWSREAWLGWWSGM
jgi:hypothetical protein